MEKKNILIQELVERYCQRDDIITNLLYVENFNCFCSFDEQKGYFKILKRLDLERKVYAYLCSNIFRNLTANTTKDFIEQIKCKIYRTADDLFSKYVAIQKGKVFNMETFEIENMGSDKTAFHYLECDPDVIQNFNGEPPKVFQEFLDYIIVDKELKPDRELQKFVQEMFGYCLLDTLEAEATFFLTGTGSNGKSVICNILETMVGKDFATAMTIEKMTTDQFATAALVGKKVNICREDESKYVRSDKFKMLVSGETTTSVKKYGEEFTWQPTVKFIFATNDIPAFSGFNHALLRRFKIIPFNRTITEKDKDTQMTKKLLAEMSGIMAWAIAGAKRLVENKFRFTQTVQMADRLELFKENLSAAVLFFNEKYEVENNGCENFVSNDELYEDYKNWADTKGKKKQSFYNFIQDVETYSKITSIDGKDTDNKPCKGKILKAKVFCEVEQPPLEF